ncbi:MAG: restriction endonuclease subunit S [Methylococcaceae bacterium]|jgi:type I restriction enzyme S subunit
MEWIEKTIGELCDIGGGEVKTGPFGSQLHQEDYSDEGTPVVMPADIIDGGISQTKIARVKESHVDRLYKHKLSIGDIIYGRRGDIGRQTIIKRDYEGWLCGTGCLRISLGNSIINPEYLHLYLKIPEVIGWIQNQAIGATMPNLNTGILRRVPVIFPSSCDNQNKIAAILSTYDDLIENNKRRIALLEKMAEEIYCEWFVRFRFPGYQTAEFEKGIPKNWEIKVMRDLVSYYVGGGWGEENESSTFSKGAYVIRGTDIPHLSSGNYTNRVFRYHKPSNFKARKLEVNDFIFEVSGGSKDQLLGRNLMVSEGLLKLFENKVICASFCKQIRFDAQKVSPLFMKYYLKLYYECDLVGIYQVQSTGISNYQFESFLNYQTISLPEKRILDEFDKLIEPIIRQQETLAFENLNLITTKDSLLPRLISGKLSVENLDIQFPPSMLDAQALYGEARS